MLSSDNKATSLTTEWVDPQWKTHYKWLKVSIIKNLEDKHRPYEEKPSDELIYIAQSSGSTDKRLKIGLASINLVRLSITIII